jgi:hypothetical protein
MPTNTYSDRVDIIKYIKLDEGWRFAPLARKPNGNIRWDTVLIGGVEVGHPAKAAISSSGSTRAVAGVRRWARFPPRSSHLPSGNEPS